MTRTIRVVFAVAVVACVGLALSTAGSGARSSTRDVAFGVADDAWLAHGPGTLESRLDELSELGVDVVRFTVRWDRVADRRPLDARDPEDPTYSWGEVDPVLRGLRRHGIDPVVTLFGTPGWANGGRAANWAPSSGKAFANFAYAAARRYPWITRWTIWNEPNRTTFLRPTTAATYVDTLLNPAYAQLHAAIDGVQVAGGVTAPGPDRAEEWRRSPGSGRWRKAGAKLDVYAHHPYPGRPQSETPWGPKCVNCQTITMADLERLEREVHGAFGRKPIWLTEYGYQTNPPDLFLGVSPEQQATYVANAALRVYRAPSVEMLIFFMVRDDRSPDGWQSGLFTVDGARQAVRTPPSGCRCCRRAARRVRRPLGAGAPALREAAVPREARGGRADELDRRHPLDRRERVLLDLGRGAAGCARPDLVAARRRVRVRAPRPLAHASSQQARTA